MDNLELLPAEGNADVGKQVFKLASEIIKDKEKKGLPLKWNEHYRQSKNDAWKNKNVGVPLESANLLHTHRQRTVNTLTDNAPTFNVSKVGEIEDDAQLDKVQRTAEYWWREQEQQSIFESSVNRGEMNGCAIEKVWFDPDKELGIGEVRTDNIDPFYFGVYPVDAKNNQDAEANLHFQVMSVRQAKRRWPKLAEQIRADAEILKDLGDTRPETAAPTQSAGGAGQFTTLVGNVVNAIFGGADEANDQVLVIECWCKDYSKETQQDGDTEISSLKYPGAIRRVTVCNAGRVVLEDVPNPSINPTLPFESASQTYLYDKFPFSVVPSVEDPCSIWGASDWEQLLGLKKAYDKTLSQFVYFKDKAVRGKIINPQDSGVDNAEFTNDTGVLNPYSANVAQAIRYLEVSNSGLMAELKGAMDHLKDLFFTVAGTFELEQVQAGNDLAYKAIAALLEHAATMMRGKIRNYQKLVRERGRMFVSLAANYYTEQRWISYEDEGANQTIPVRGEELIVPAKLTVVSGSTLPKAEMAKREEALQLFQAGAIDDEALLQALDYPGRAGILQRKREGTAGVLMQRFAEMGFPQEMLQIMGEVAAMDDKGFEKAAKSGEVPQLQLPQTEQPTNQLEQGEMAKAQAEVELTRAKAMMESERAFTEQIKQRQMLAGIEFDVEKLNIERRKLGLAEMSEIFKTAMPSENRPGYNERGMVSNNVEA